MDITQKHTTDVDGSDRPKTLAMFVVTRTGEEHEMTRGIQHLPHLLRAIALACGVDEFIAGKIVSPKQGRFLDRFAIARKLVPALDDAIILGFHMTPDAWLAGMDQTINLGCSFVTDEVTILEKAN